MKALPLALITGVFPGRAPAMEFRFFKKKCEAPVASVPEEVFQNDLSDRILGMLDGNNTYRESRARFLGTVSTMKHFEVEFDRLTQDYAKLLPELNQAYVKFSKAPSSSTKDDLESALLRVEILLDQVKHVCERLKNAVSIRIHELKVGILRRDEVMRTLPPSVLEMLKNPRNLEDVTQVMGDATKLSHLEISVMEEFHMIAFFIGFQGQIVQTMRDGFSPVLQEKIKLVNFALGRDLDQRKNSDEAK